MNVRGMLWYAREVCGVHVGVFVTVVRGTSLQTVSYNCWLMFDVMFKMCLWSFRSLCVTQ